MGASARKKVTAAMHVPFQYLWADVISLVDTNLQGRNSI